MVPTSSGPAGPCGPVVPIGPCGPVVPIGPCGPVGPIGPCSPVGPIGPTGPADPAGPVGPVGPAGPATAVAGPAMWYQSLAPRAGALMVPFRFASTQKSSPVKMAPVVTIAPGG